MKECPELEARPYVPGYVRGYDRRPDIERLKRDAASLTLEIIITFQRIAETMPLLESSLEKIDKFSKSDRILDVLDIDEILLDAAGAAEHIAYLYHSMMCKILKLLYKVRSI